MLAFAPLCGGCRAIAKEDEYKDHSKWGECAVRFLLTGNNGRSSMLSMSTLGLSGEPPKDENRLKALFWPTIQNAHDADVVSQMGFWVCQIAALISGLSLGFTGHPVLAAFVLAFYFLGGVGVREGSAAAAILVFSAYLLDLIASVRMGMGMFGILQFVVFAILLSNVRSSLLVARWKKLPRTDGDEELEPMRFNETWRDKFSDQMPRIVWPKLRVVFYVCASLFMALEVLGILVAFFGAGVIRSR
jgi:hypothetical protein